MSSTIPATRQAPEDADSNAGAAEPTRDIAAAAIEFIEARQNAAELRAARAEILRESDCTGSYGKACYQVERLPYPAWCHRCRDAQRTHTEYKSAVTRRTTKLVRLKRLVLNRASISRATEGGESK